MSERKRVIITGISSELMQSFVALIDPKKYEVIGISRNPEGIHMPGVQIVRGDILAIEELGPIFKDCEIVVHAAAITHSFSETPYYDVNLQATKDLVDLSLNTGVNKFVFISSRAAGEKSGAYGRSKILAETYIQEKIQDWLILRPSEIFGGDKKEGIDKLIRDALQKKIVSCPVGIRSKLYPLHIKDAAELMYRYGFDEETDNKVYTINGPSAYSFRDIIQAVGKAAGKRHIILPLPRILLFFARWIIKLFSLNLGFVPDQVDRLYSEKEHEKINYKFFTLEDYLEESLKSIKQ